MVNVKGIDATYYVVSDLDKVQQFYAGILGKPSMEQPGMFCEWTFTDDSSFGLYKSPSAEPGANGMVMFAVDDIPSAVADAKKHGAKFPHDEITETEVCHMHFGEDPEGNEFMFHKRK